MPSFAAVAPPPRFSRDLDYLLRQVAEALQLSKTQYGAAETSYHAVAEWLSAPESPLAKLRPHVFPHGSVALGTTVRPRRGAKDDEYDVDCVCKLAHSSLSAMDVYGLVHRRLTDHDTYRGMLERKKRCLRLNYRGQYHLDILPAIPDLQRGGTSLWVPDREVQRWTVSDPEGFRNWFRRRAESLLVVARADADPLPEQPAPGEQAALAVCVQLLKRRRDMVFDGSDDAPRSIVLTTLAASVYRGETSVGEALAQVVVAISAKIREAGPGRLRIPNPVNDAEDLGESLDAPGRYELLRSFVSNLERELASLPLTKGPALAAVLQDMFGEGPTNTAYERYDSLLQSRRDCRSLTATGAGGGVLGIVAPVSSATVPRHRYFGG